MKHNTCHTPKQAGQNHQGHHVADFQKRFWISLLFTIPILLLSPMIQHALKISHLFIFKGDKWALFVLASFVFFYGGWPFLKGTKEEICKKQPGMMTLIGIATSTAYFYSTLVIFGLRGEMFFWELATLVDIMLLGHWIEMKSILGAGQALEELAKLMPNVAHKMISTGSVIDVPLSELVIGDKVLVKPGEKVPADGIVLIGETTVNESMLTGESQPIIKQKDAVVIGGSINGEGSITIQIQKTGKDSFLSTVIDLVKEAQESKSKTQDIANRAALWLTFIALAGGALTLLFWWGFTERGIAFALERMVTVMVITCPHALGLAVPLVVAVSTSLAAQNGLLIRNRAAFETARHINALVFDKTGTLTEGTFGITDVLLMDNAGMEPQELLNYAAAVEAHSEHPIAKGIVRSQNKMWNVEKFRAIPGKGTEGIVAGHSIKVVSPAFLQEMGIQYDDSRIIRLMQEGNTVVFVLVNESVKGVIALSDIVRPESRKAIKQLKAMGIHCMMLTGDNEAVAKRVAENLGLDEYVAEVLPKEKVDKIRAIQARGFLVGMTGDGVNDAPALAQADVGIAIGAGTEVAVETADIILVKSNPWDVVTTITLARATTKKMIQNLIWATGYNTIAIPLAAGVLFKYGIWLSPAAGAVFMSLSTIIVAINAKLLRIKE